MFQSCWFWEPSAFGPLELYWPSHFSSLFLVGFLASVFKQRLGNISKVALETVSYQ